MDDNIRHNLTPTVLVVEDEEDMRQNLAELLGDEFKIYTASNGEQALRIYYNEQFRLNVVLLDIRLPDMSGIEILKKMKNINLNPDIIMVTALNDTKNAVEAMRDGAYDYVTKPFFAGDLIATIKRALEKKDYNRKLRELTDRLDHERIAAEHRQILFQEMQMKGRLEGKPLSGEEKALFNFPVLSEEDYDYEKLKEKLEKDLDSKIDVGEGAKVVIASSDREIRDQLDKILVNNYSIISASSAHELFAQLTENKINLVILDINMMIDMEGDKVLEKIKNEFQSTDVIVATERQEVQSAVHAMKAGAYDYLTKPFIADDINVSVKRVLEKQVAKDVLDKLVDKYREVRLSFDPRLNLFKQLFVKRKKQNQTISMDDFYTFFPEFREDARSLDLGVSFPEFRDETKLENFILRLRDKSSRNK